MRLSTLLEQWNIFEFEHTTSLDSPYLFMHVSAINLTKNSIIFCWGLNLQTLHILYIVFIKLIPREQILLIYDGK